MGSLTLVRDDTRGALTDRQREILDFITQSIRERGYPPTLREIGLHFGIRSTNGVNDHLRALEKKGYLQREDLKSRALRPGRRAAVPMRAPAREEDMIDVPLVGRVAAGRAAARRREHRGHREGRPLLHRPDARGVRAAREGRLDDRRRHLRRRLHLRAQAAARRTAATSWSR